MSLRVFPPVTVHERGQEVLDQLRREVQTQLKQAALDGSMAQPRRFVPERDGYWDGFAYRIDPDFVVLKDKIDRHRHELRPR